jgi:hypothetical protein
MLPKNMGLFDAGHLIARSLLGKLFEPRRRGPVETEME